jgi:hypothetical protein
MMFVSLPEFYMEARVVGEIMGHDRSSLSGGETKVLLIGNFSLSFGEGVGRIISTLIESRRQMQIDVLVKIDLDA